ncbi:RagB/SusD family nutrient uptake outer membrane protein [Paludibacter sp.]
MKTIKKIYYAVICTLVVGFTACDDILSTDPQDFNTLTNFFQNESQVLNALAGCYTTLTDLNSYGGQLTFEALVDDLGYWNWKTTPSNMINKPYGWNYNSSNATVKSMWNNLYSGIGRANMLLENIDNADMKDDLRETYRQEARFLRAYYHFLLNIYWGDIPLRMKSIEDVSEVNVPRVSTDSVTRVIIAEMEDVIAGEKLTLATDHPHAARITQTAAQAILARVCLKAAGYPLNLGEPMYRKALDYAMQVKESNIHRLHPVYRQLFINQSADVYDVTYRESIWEAEFVGNSVTDPDKSTGYSSIGSRIGIECQEADHIGYGYGFVCARLKLTDLYDKDPNDTRKARNIADYKINSSGTKTTITNVGERTAGKWRREDEKLMPRHKNYTSTNVSIIRYADVLLMIAEAENELNGPTAIAHNALNEVRQRAGAITFTEDNGNNFYSKDDFFKEIQDERARELCFEGVRKMDLVRWGIFVSEMRQAANQAMNDSRATSRREMMTEVAGKMSTRDILFPIPQSELKLNNKMTQNPLW